jgi:hypothetical protein
VLDFRRGRHPRNYSSRREQWRLLMMVMMLGLVIILAGKARDPRNYEWLVGPQNSVVPKGGSAQKPRPDPAARKRLLAEVDRELMETVRDNAPIREYKALYHLFGILAKHDLTTIEAASAGPVTRSQILEQPKEYRGDLVTVTGIVRRAEELAAAENDAGIKRYYRVVITPHDSPGEIVVVNVLELPDKFPIGDGLAENVELTGFVFKRWSYPAQDRERFAPLLLAKALRWYPRVESAPRPRATIAPVWIVAAAALFAALVVVYMAGRTRRGDPLRRMASPKTIEAPRATEDPSADPSAPQRE